MIFSIIEVFSPGTGGEASFQISIWAVLFGVLLGGVILYVLYNQTVRRGQKRMEAMRATLEREHQKELEAQKQNLLTSLSQDLRTPITFIIGPLQQLAEENVSDEVGGRVQMILKNAQILLHYVNMLPVGVKHGVLPTMVPAGAPLVSAVTKNREQEEGDKELGVRSEELGVRGKEQGVGVDDSNAAAAASLHEENEQEMDGEQHRFTMLMVDDSADMCRFVRDYFRGEYNVLTAANGEQAVKCLEENDNIDLVVSDVKMPKMDGFELCKFIKTNLRWSHIPVILLTGHTGEQMELEGLKLGADDYITKPFNVEMLRLRVKKFIEKRENRQRQFREKVDVAPSEITITSVDERFIQQAIKICEDHIADSDFSVEELGRQLSLSRTYLYKKLIHITGKGPAEFIRTIRMKRGKQYLEGTSMQITEIATALGYNSPKRFTENFKTEYGMSPSEYGRRFRMKS